MTPTADPGMRRHMSIPDFKLNSLIRIGAKSNYAKIVQCTPKTDALRLTVDAFLANVKRIQGLAFMPFVLYAHTWHFGRSWAMAGFQHTTKFDIVSPTDPNYAAVLQLAHEIKGNTLGAVAKSRQLESELMNEAADNINVVLGPQEVFEHIHPWLGSLLISEWSAFEILATDLWVAAVNSRPSSLGRAALQAPRRKDDDSPLEEASEDKKPADKKTAAVSLDTLQRYGYNLSNRMGDMLKAQRKWSFNSAKTIRFAYTDAFGKESNWPRQDSDYKTIAHLEAVRHLLVHRAGVVDQTFIDRIGADSLFSGVALVKRLTIDGDMVNFFMNLVIDYSCKYIKFVDEWLINHPE